ncbi:[NiFe]-hydrogenase assembly chaperone HybE [Acidithiobacillus ferrivorans]|nr:[NiFe]-hydrogenase assembly chaperone HybE [Acidithiobacillus ferrivorans]
MKIVPGHGESPLLATRHLVDAFQRAADRQRGLSFFRSTLAVETVGFRPWQGCQMGVLITPWFMNLIILPGPGMDWSAFPVGTQQRWHFPSGSYEFTGGHIGNLGPYQSCALFSPVPDFADQAAAHAAARSALDALFTPPDSEPGRLACPLSRRGFLGGKWTGDRPP